MVGKNNILIVEQKRSDKHCRYGIRKLSVGVASVLLGVGFFAGNSVAHADTTDVSSDNKDVDVKNSHKIDTSQGVYGTQQNSTSQTASSQTESTSAQANVTRLASQNSVDSSKKESILEASGVTPASVQGLSESKVAVNDIQQETSPGVTIPANQDGNENKKLVGTGKVSEVTLDDGSSLNVSSDLLDSKNQTAILTFKSSAFKAGDTYTIRIPDAGGLRLSETDVATLQPSFVTTTFSHANGWYVITNRFINSGTVNQAIKLTRDVGSIAQISKLGSYSLVNNMVSVTHDGLDNKVLQTNVLLAEAVLLAFGMDGTSSTYDQLSVNDRRNALVVNNSDTVISLSLNLMQANHLFGAKQVVFHINESKLADGVRIKSISYVTIHFNDSRWT